MKKLIGEFKVSNVISDEGNVENDAGHQTQAMIETNIVAAKAKKKESITNVWL